MNNQKTKKIWITGASAGIGKALALAYAKEGAKLVLSSRKRPALEEVKSLCVGSPKVDILPLDLEKHEEIDQIFKANINLIKDVDLLINNGGISQRSKVSETQFEVYQRLMDINYLGTVQLSTLLLPYFVERNCGQFAVITSVAGKFGVPYRSGYSASKMALHGFFDALRAELNHTNINVTMICPGFIKTDISVNSLTGSGEKLNEMDEAQANGMDVNTFADKAIKAINHKKEEVYIGAFRETTLAILVSRLFPSLFKKIISKSKVR